MMSEIQLGFVGSARYLWRQLTSMRTALILLLLTGLAAIPGSLIPQRTNGPIPVQDYFQANPGLAKFFDQLWMFDVYGSPWFSSIYILLFISLIGCVIPRVIGWLTKAPKVSKTAWAQGDIFSPSEPGRYPSSCPPTG